MSEAVYEQMKPIAVGSRCTWWEREEVGSSSLSVRHGMPNEFTVVGEYKADSQWLLVEGTDGKFYSYHPRRKRLVRVQPDERGVFYADATGPDDQRHRPKTPPDGEARVSRRYE